MSLQQVTIRDSLINLLGVETAQILMRTKGIGGQKHTMPMGRGNVKAIKVAIFDAAIGAEATNKLLNHFKGEDLYIPKDDVVIRHQRNLLMVEKYSTGVSIRDLTIEFGLSDRRIREILKTTDTNTSK